MIIRDKKGTPILDLGFNVVNGELPDISIVRQFGRVVNLGVSEYTIWTGSGNPFFPMSSTILPETYIASTNSADIAGGVKAAEYACVTYLSSGCIERVEVHSLNGLTPVKTDFPVWRVNDIRVLSKNYTAINTGSIWIGNSGFTAGIPAAKYGHIQSGIGKSYQACYSTPRDKFAYIYDVTGTVNEGKAGAIQVFVQSFSETFSGFPGVFGLNQGIGNYDIFESTMARTCKFPMRLLPRSDIIFKGCGGATGTNISVEWTMLLVSASYFTNDNR